MKKSCNKTKRIMLAGSLMLVLCCVIGVTYAVLNTKTDVATNAFNGKMVNIVVNENGKDVEDTQRYLEFTEHRSMIPKVVKIKNLTSSDYPTTDTYVRVRLVPIFRDYDGDNVQAATLNIGYLFGPNVPKWKEQKINGESYYYYPQPVKPGEVTNPLIIGVTCLGLPGHTHLEVEVLADGIQARPKEAIKGAWGITEEELANLPDVPSPPAVP